MSQCIGYSRRSKEGVKESPIGEFVGRFLGAYGASRGGFATFIHKGRPEGQPQAESLPHQDRRVTQRWKAIDAERWVLAILGGGLHGLKVFVRFGEGFLEKNFSLGGLEAAHIGFETVI